MASLCAIHPTGYRDEKLEIDFENRLVRIESRNVKLTRKEFDLLSLLVSQAGRTVPHALLLDQVWGYKAGTRTRTLDVHICRVRRKLAPAGRDYIETIFGVGARFQAGKEPLEASSAAQAG